MYYIRVYVRVLRVSMCELRSSTRNIEDCADEFYKMIHSKLSYRMLCSSLDFFFFFGVVWLDDFGQKSTLRWRRLIELESTDDFGPAWCAYVLMFLSDDATTTTTTTTTLCYNWRTCGKINGRSTLFPTKIDPALYKNDGSLARVSTCSPFRAALMSKNMVKEIK